MTPQDKKELELPVPEEVEVQQVLGTRPRNNFPESLIILAKHKLFLISFVAGVAILSAVISIILTPIYSATAKLMPPQQGQSVASALLSQLSSLSPLVGLAGSGAGAKTPSDLYVTMLRSRTVADDIIDQYQLMTVYHAKFHEDARKRLALVSDIAAAKDGVISIVVDDPDPRRAANIATAYVRELEKLTQNLAVTDASKRKFFFERAMKAEKDQLEVAETQFKQAQERTGIIEPNSQSKVMLQSYAELRAQGAEKEIEIQAMRSFATPDNPDLIRAQNQLAALRTQIARFEVGQGGRPIGDIALGKVPGRELEYLRKLRDMKYHETLFEMLAKQYEIARIDESKDFALIQVLDDAEVPEKRIWPHRTALVLASTLLAFIVGVGIVVLMEKSERFREDPQFMANWQVFKFYLRGRRNS